MVKVITGDRVCREGRLALGCSAAVFDPAGERLLLVRRTDSGRWAVPGGYMEPGESLQEACAREVFEETGIEVHVGRLIAAYTNPHRLVVYTSDQRLQIVALFFEAAPVGGELATSEETSEVRYFTPAEIEGLEMGEFDRQRVADALAGETAAIVREEMWVKDAR